MTPIAMKTSTIKRTLPTGLAGASLDYHAYGKWPGAVDCKSCVGTGNFYGRDEDGDCLECDECDVRGWNPPPGGPHELEIELFTTYSY